MNNSAETTVLKWARESIGYSQEEVIEHLKLKTVDLEKLNQWESGESQPTYPQLKKLSELYKRPVALFFFPEPPQEQPIKKEFRSLPDRVNADIPPKIRYLVRKAKVRQMDLEELNIGSQQEVKVFNWNIDEDIQNPETLAEKVRNYLGLSLQDQISWKNADEALNKWREAVEGVGIWVFKDSFNNNGYCGFCIYDRKFPIIYINNNQAKERQIFTLFHELGHILRRDGGIDFGIAPPELTGDYKNEEVFCNAFAGHFLVPSEGLNYSSLPDDNAINGIAKKYKVSYEVILRKFRDRNLISSRGYEAKIAQRRKSPPVKKKSRGNYFLAQKAYLGKKYIDTVFAKYYQQQISREQVADYLGIKISSVSKMEGLV